jgi:hypothetical protein
MTEHGFAETQMAVPSSLLVQAVPGGCEEEDSGEPEARRNTSQRTRQRRRYHAEAGQEGAARVTMRTIP